MDTTPAERLNSAITPTDYLGRTLEARCWSRRTSPLQPAGTEHPEDEVFQCLPEKEQLKRPAGERGEARRSLVYFFTSGGKWSNIFSTPLLRFLMFLSDLSERVSLDDPRQINVLVCASNRSTTRVPTL
jgi:hypothetical protein